MGKNTPDSKIVKEWIEKADDDMGYAKASLEEELKFFDLICFHFQQAAEKYLKAYIIARGFPFKKIHELPVLLDICKKADRSFTELAEECNFLTDFYVESRYPVFWPKKVDKKIASEAYEAAKKIEDFVKEKLLL